MKTEEVLFFPIRYCHIYSELHIIAFFEADNQQELERNRINFHGLQIYNGYCSLFRQIAGTAARIQYLFVFSFYQPVMGVAEDDQVEISRV